jgi:Ricin-type beta-trefoil lectin domain
MLSKLPRGRRLIRLAATAGLIGSAVVGMSGTAFANGQVTWKNAHSNACLRSDATSLDAQDVFTGPCIAWNGLANTDDYWYDVLDPSVGDYVEQSETITPGGIACLDSNNQWGSYGSVYVIQCNSGNYQNWWENSTSTGWQLQDAQTGLVLDGASGPNNDGQFSNYVFTSTADNNDSWQRWH